VTVGSAPARLRRRLEVMGTVFTLDLVTDLPEAELAPGIDDAFAWLRWVDDTFSTYKPGSEISRLRRGELSPEQCHTEVRGVLAACRQLTEETEGYFDAWAGPTRALDPSGLVKGWAAERASGMLSAAGATDHCLNAAGDIALAGAPAPGQPWRIGIAHPLVPQRLTTVVAVGEGGVATSGTAERGCHVVNPHTGRPAVGLASVTVIGPSLAAADAYATAAVAMGTDAPVWLSSLDGYESFVLDAAGHLWRSAGFAALQVA